MHYFLSGTGELFERRRIDFDQIVERIRRRRLLKSLAALSPEQIDELRRLQEPRYFRVLGGPTTVIGLARSLTRSWLQRRGRVMGMLFLLLIVGALLPALAFAQSKQIREGREDFGSQLGLFAYNARSVSIARASTFAPPEAFDKYIGQKLFMLGQTSEYVILYWQARDSTVRIPVRSVVVSNS
jgi:hypothetical protein